MEILLATSLIALLSLLGVVVFGDGGHLVGSRRYIVPFAIGTFLGVTFFELIPETLAVSETYGAFSIVAGFLSFYVLAHYLGTYHHHHDSDVAHSEDDDCESDKASAVLLLIGDAVHNFIDGVVIASAFLVNPVAGWITTFGIALHEAPQEIAEYGVLRHAGYTRNEAAFYNFVSAGAVIVGAGSVLFAASFFSGTLFLLTGVAAGNLLYVAMSDLIPNVQASTRSHGRFGPVLLSTLMGLALIVSLLVWSHEHFGHMNEIDHEHEHEHGHETPDNH